MPFFRKREINKKKIKKILLYFRAQTLKKRKKFSFSASIQFSTHYLSYLNYFINYFIYKSCDVVNLPFFLKLHKRRVSRLHFPTYLLDPFLRFNLTLKQIDQGQQYNFARHQKDTLFAFNYFKKNLTEQNFLKKLKRAQFYVQRRKSIADNKILELIDQCQRFRSFFFLLNRKSKFRKIFNNQIKRHHLHPSLFNFFFSRVGRYRRRNRGKVVFTRLFKKINFIFRFNKKNFPSLVDFPLPLKFSKKILYLKKFNLYRKFFYALNFGPEFYYQLKFFNFVSSNRNIVLFARKLLKRKKNWKFFNRKKFFENNYWIFKKKKNYKTRFSGIFKKRILAYKAYALKKFFYQKAKFSINFKNRQFQKQLLLKTKHYFYFKKRNYKKITYRSMKIVRKRRYFPKTKKILYRKFYRFINRRFFVRLKKNKIKFFSRKKKKINFFFPSFLFLKKILKKKLSVKRRVLVNCSIINNKHLNKRPLNKRFYLYCRIKHYAEFRLNRRPRRKKRIIIKRRLRAIRRSLRSQRKNYRRRLAGKKKKRQQRILLNIPEPPKHLFKAKKKRKNILFKKPIFKPRKSIKVTPPHYLTARRDLKLTSMILTESNQFSTPLFDFTDINKIIPSCINFKNYKFINKKRLKKNFFGSLVSVASVEPIFDAMENSINGNIVDTDTLVLNNSQASKNFPPAFAVAKLDAKLGRAFLHRSEYARSHMPKRVFRAIILKEFRKKKVFETGLANLFARSSFKKLLPTVILGCLGKFVYLHLQAWSKQLNWRVKQLKLEQFFESLLVKTQFKKFLNLQFHNFTFPNNSSPYSLLKQLIFVTQIIKIVAIPSRNIVILHSPKKILKNILLEKGYFKKNFKKLFLKKLNIPLRKYLTRLRRKKSKFHEFSKNDVLLHLLRDIQWKNKLAGHAEMKRFYRTIISHYSKNTAFLVNSSVKLLLAKFQQNKKKSFINKKYLKSNTRYLKKSYKKHIYLLKRKTLYLKQLKKKYKKNIRKLFKSRKNLRFKYFVKKQKQKKKKYLKKKKYFIKKKHFNKKKHFSKKRYFSKKRLLKLEKNKFKINFKKPYEHKSRLLRLYRKNKVLRKFVKLFFTRHLWWRFRLSRRSQFLSFRTRSFFRSRPRRYSIKNKNNSLFDYFSKDLNTEKKFKPRKFRRYRSRSAVYNMIKPNEFFKKIFTRKSSKRNTLRIRLKKKFFRSILKIKKKRFFSVFQVNRLGRFFYPKIIISLIYRNRRLFSYFWAKKQIISRLKKKFFNSFDTSARFIIFNSQKYTFYRMQRINLLKYSKHFFKVFLKYKKKKNLYKKYSLIVPQKNSDSQFFLKKNYTIKKRLFKKFFFFYTKALIGIKKNFCNYYSTDLVFPYIKKKYIPKKYFMSKFFFKKKKLVARLHVSPNMQKSFFLCRNNKFKKIFTASFRKNFAFKKKNYRPRYPFFLLPTQVNRRANRFNEIPTNFSSGILQSEIFLQRQVYAFRFIDVFRRILKEIQFFIFRRKYRRFNRLLKKMNRMLRKQKNLKLFYFQRLFFFKIKYLFKVRRARRLSFLLKLKYKFQKFFTKTYAYKKKSILFLQLKKKYKYSSLCHIFRNFNLFFFKKNILRSHLYKKNKINYKNFQIKPRTLFSAGFLKTVPSITKKEGSKLKSFTADINIQKKNLFFQIFQKKNYNNKIRYLTRNFSLVKEKNIFFFSLLNRRYALLRFFIIMESQINILLYRLRFIPSLKLVPKIFFYKLVFLNEQLVHNPFTVVNLYDLIQVPVILTKKFYFYAFNQNRLEITQNKRIKYFFRLFRILHNPFLQKMWLPQYCTVNLYVSGIILHAFPNFLLLLQPFSRFLKNRRLFNSYFIPNGKAISLDSQPNFRVSRVKKKFKYIKFVTRDFCLLRLKFFSYLSYYTK